MHALIVDDSSAMRAFLRLALKGAGFSTAEARNGREGLQSLERSNPDIVLLDWNMPEMDGFSMLRAMRADARWKDVKVMMVTTETEMAEMARALGAGADEYVMKPFTREVILEKLEILGMMPQAL
ncbi:response regulator receiver protein, CheY [Candidatus Koribacter versatilis Ellin345]|uniref:Response regulator receiver protein, CheY n=1 Tax=Koribacter versatilis (strain Ellin345) TaxID=204669 RepID=Q1IRH1_KORVE|nr:response regulator [Candidatus Koribacter versatilis]ABF40529.1 response regulator receiver protein, CheY [Candidatus Koribacter versatilis Ellin345]